MISPTVSILTVTQLSRNKCLLNLVQFIKNQTYKNIFEWVIVEGSKNKDDANDNKEKINEIILSEKNININYVDYSGFSFDNLHNLGNEICAGDIIVIMDDDDYYPPTRVEHVVESINDSNYLIAGCSDVYMYSFIKQKLYKFKPFGENHSCNHAIGYIKEYTYKNKYKDDGYSIEKSFTKKFTEPMYQLDPLKTVVVSSHKYNSIDKNKLIDIWIEINVLYEITEKKITDLIPEDIFIKMKNVFE